VTSTVSTNTASDVHGPVDFVLLEFRRDRLTGEASQALADLVEQGVIRLYDLLVISKDDDGGVEVLELGDPSGVDGFAYFSGARSGLLGDEDVEEAASAMQPGTVAALIVYENSWAIPFVAAARGSGGELIASARIPAPDVMAAMDAAESSESA
jgi:dihydroorotase-like cyclic amidohydrolase